MKTMFPALRAAKTIDLVLKKVVVTDAANGQFMSCDIHLAGKNLGSYVDQGNGGHGDFHLIRKDQENLQEQMRKASVPVMPHDDAATMQIGPYADSAIALLICEVLMLKSMKRLCKNNTVIVFTDDAFGAYHQYPYTFTAEAKSAATATLGDRIAFFVNEDILTL